MSGRTLPPPDLQRATPGQGTPVDANVERALRAELALVADPAKRKGILVRLAEQVEAKDALEATELYETALALGADADVRSRLARILDASGAFREAAVEYEKLAEQAPSKDERLRARHRAATLFLWSGAPERACALAELDTSDPFLNRIYAAASYAQRAIELRSSDKQSDSRALLDVTGAFPMCELGKELGARVAARLVRADRGDGLLAWRVLEADPAAPEVALPFEHADEVRRTCARGRSWEAAVHLQRFHNAVAASDKPAALRAAIDAGIDLIFEGDDARAFDLVLLDLKMFEVVAARTEVRIHAAHADPKLLLSLWVELGDLCAGPLNEPARAITAYGEALRLNPLRSDVLERLERYARGDLASMYVDALARIVVSSAPKDDEGRTRILHALLDYAKRNEVPEVLRFVEEQLRVANPAATARPPAMVVSELSTLPPEQIALAQRARFGELRKDPARMVERDACLTDLISALDAAGVEIPADEGSAWVRSATLLGQKDVAVARLRTLSKRSQGLARQAFMADLVIVERDAPETFAAQAAARDLFGGAPMARAAAVAWAQGAKDSDFHLRAEAIALAASLEVASVRGSLLLAASDLLLGVGSPRAFQVAADAIASSPGTARAAMLEVTLKASTRGQETPALRLAIGMLGPVPRLLRSAAYVALLEERPAEAIKALETCLLVKEGDPDTVSELLRAVLAERDAQRVRRALMTLLDTHFINLPACKPFADALESLMQSDPQLAQEVAGRALTRFGLGNLEMRGVLFRIADKSKNPQLAVKILEQWLATKEGSRDPDLHLALAQRRSALGDLNGEARALCKAVSLGADPRTTQLWLDQLTASLFRLERDVAVTLIEARIEQATRGNDRVRLSRGYRDLGMILWETKGEKERSVQLWVKAARTAPQIGVPALGADLMTLLGAPGALRILREVAESEKEPELAGAFAAEAARVASSAGDLDAAFAFAQKALRQNPSRADALEIAEKGSVAASRVREMSVLYTMVAQSSLGKFGRRAAHYRGARYFEMHGASDLAVEHAAKAFLSVPSEGATFSLLRRTAQRGGKDVGVRTLEEVATQARSDAERAEWLVRAAGLFEGEVTEAGFRTQGELLARAVGLAPSTTSLMLLERALAEQVRTERTRIPELAEQLQALLATVAPKLEGPSGARIALQFARIALGVFGGQGSADALIAAFAATGDVDEYQDLIGYAPVFVTSEGAAGIERVFAAALQANLGAAGAELMWRIAAEARDEARSTEALLIHIEKSDGTEHVLDAEARMLAVGSDAQRRRFQKAVPDDRLGAALLARAQARRAAGHAAEGEEDLKRALGLSDEDVRSEAQRLLAAVWDAREDVLPADRAADDTVDGNAAVAAEWGHRAAKFERVGDMHGALDAWTRAAQAEPEMLERWFAVERASELAGDNAANLQALLELSRRMTGKDGVAVAKRLARALEVSGDIDAAEAQWSRVLAEDPDDDDADAKLEGFLGRRGDFEGVAVQLRRRAARLSDRSPEAARAVRLRLVAVLEQRLGRPREARELLEDLAGTGSSHAKRYLADLCERLNEFERAADLWSELERTSSETELVELRVRRARALSLANRAEEALVLIEEVFVKNLRNLDVLAARVDICRKIPGRPLQLGEALELLAHAMAPGAIDQAELLVEAAHAAARAGDVDLSLARAQRAADLAPSFAKAQLYARALEYRLRGAGTPDQARRTVQSLEYVRGALGPEDGSLRAFLLAEALDATEGNHAGVKLLRDARLSVGLTPLIALGLAERVAARKEYREAVLLYRAALGGDLLSLRRIGSVALAGADIAQEVGDSDALRFFLECASEDPVTRERASKRLMKHLLLTAERERAVQLANTMVQAVGDDGRAALALSLGVQFVRAPDSAFIDDGVRLLKFAMRAAKVGSEDALVAQSELDALGERLSLSSHPAIAALSVRNSLTPGVALNAPRMRSLPPDERVPVEQLRSAAEEGSKESEEALMDAAGQGNAEAADALGDLAHRRDPGSDNALLYRQMAVELRPGNLRLLAKLREVVVARGSVAHGRALDHILRAWDEAAGPVVAPTLEVQTEVPGLLQLIAKHSTEPSGMAMAIVWEACGPLLVRVLLAEPAPLGLERVVPGPGSRIGRLLEFAARLLDVPRTPIFQSTQGVECSYRILLGAPPSGVVCATDASPSHEVAFALGQALSGATVPNALVLAPQEPMILWDALLRAFGPQASKAPMGQAARSLVELIWQSVSGRAQIRLKELLAQDVHVPFELVQERARQSGRRLGLFLSGDFSYAATQTLRELGSSTRIRKDTLEEVCRAYPQVADLYRLAIRAEFARGRWGVGRT